MSPDARRVTIVQYAGDFREAALRLAAGGEENYRGQRYTVSYVEELALRVGEVTTITGFTETPYDVILPSGARAMGAGFKDRFDAAAVADLVRRTKPTHIILRTPNLRLLAAVARMRVPTLALLADSFQTTTLKERLKRRLVVYFLNGRCIERVGNHGRNAARQLVEAGVSADKVMAWDYPQWNQPDDLAPKQRATGHQLLYVGLVQESKGVGDTLRAVAEISKSHPSVRLDIVGEGQTDAMRQLAAQLGIAEQVRFVGRVANTEVMARMRAADVVLVPSRHAYPEGLPLTIYEALCSRTPLVLSDHPMFVGNVEHEVGGLVFSEKDHMAMANNVRRLFDDAPLYQKLSSNAQSAWEAVQLPTTWGGLIDQWLQGAHAVQTTAAAGLSASPAEAAP